MCIFSKGFIMKKTLKQYKKIIALVVMMMIVSLNSSYAASVASVKAQPSKAKTTTVATVPTGIKVDPVKVVDNPAFYLNKNITFEADFVAFSSLGLDYNPALRSSNEYIGVLIARTDVVDHVIPLSEMKIFIKRTEAEKHVDIEQGDKIKITGTVFSNALGDPWVDAKVFTVLETKSEKKN